ncbi:hypothetical protein GCM10025777_56730 [Membranihabitans marinus]
MEFIKQFNIDFAEGNISYLTDRVTDDIIWQIIGDKIIVGKTNFVKAMEEMKSIKVSELTITQVLSHGKVGAAHGIITLDNGEQYGFSDFYDFHGAKAIKIKKITSYSIKCNDNKSV